MVLVYYEDCILASSVLQTWMLSRRGSFRSAYIPFFQSFVKLYQTTRSLSTCTPSALKPKIEEWIRSNNGIQTMPLKKRIVLIQQGLSLFSQWTELLYDQTIIEFR